MFYRNLSYRFMRPLLFFLFNHNIIIYYAVNSIRDSQRFSPLILLLFYNVARNRDQMPFKSHGSSRPSGSTRKYATSLFTCECMWVLLCMCIHIDTFLCYNVCIYIYYACEGELSDYSCTPRKLEFPNIYYVCVLHYC